MVRKGIKDLRDLITAFAAVLVLSKTTIQNTKPNTFSFNHLKLNLLSSLFSTFTFSFSPHFYIPLIRLYYNYYFYLLVRSYNCWLLLKVVSGCFVRLDPLYATTTSTTTFESDLLLHTTLSLPCFTSKIQHYLALNFPFFQIHLFLFSFLIKIIS